MARLLSSHSVVCMAIGLSDRRTKRASDRVCMAPSLSSHYVARMAFGLSDS